jgi:hypothetical protein
MAKNKNAVAAAVIATAASQVETITTPKAETKADKARAIFAECYSMNPVPQRKDILARIQNEAGCTKAGSATYLQIYKDKNGLSAKKSTAVTA